MPNHRKPDDDPCPQCGQPRKRVGHSGTLRCMACHNLRAKTSCRKCGQPKSPHQGLVDRTGRAYIRWTCKPCDDAGRQKALDDYRVSAASKRAAEPEDEVIDVELEKVAARIAFQGVRLYYDPREARRREFERLAQEARRKQA